MQRVRASDPDHRGMSILLADATAAAHSGVDSAVILHENIQVAPDQRHKTSDDMSIKSASESAQASVTNMQLHSHASALRSLGMGYASQAKSMRAAGWKRAATLRRQSFQSQRSADLSSASSNKLPELQAHEQDWEMAHGIRSSTPNVDCAAAAAASSLALRAPRHEWSLRNGVAVASMLSKAESGALDSAKVDLATSDRTMDAVQNWARQSLAPPGALVLELSSHALAVPAPILRGIVYALSQVGREASSRSQLDAKIVSGSNRAQ